MRTAGNGQPWSAETCLRFGFTVKVERVFRQAPSDEIAMRGEEVAPRLLPVARH